MQFNIVDYNDLTKSLLSIAKDMGLLTIILWPKMSWELFHFCIVIFPNEFVRKIQSSYCQSFNLNQYKLSYTVSNNIVVYEEPVSRANKIPLCAVKFEAGEENRIVYESLCWLPMTN